MHYSSTPILQYSIELTSVRQISANLQLSNYSKFSHPLKLSQKTHIVLKKELNIINAIFEHGDSFYSHPKGET